MSKDLINNTYKYLGLGQDRLKSYKISKYKDKTIDRISRNRYVFL